MTDEPNASCGRDELALVENAVAACRKLNGKLGAFVDIADANVQNLSGPLAGLPIAIKDMVDVAGRAPTLGLQHAVRSVPTRNARIIDRLSDAGVTIVAFAEMSPLAFESSGANPYRGRPLNPWNENYICGGSSSGPAVAVAAGCVPLALGSDTAGSLRIPAHCCGITAWKPSYGMVPNEGTMPLAPDLDTIGFLARAACTIAPMVELFANGKERSPIRRVAVAHDLTRRSAAAIQNSVTAMEQTLRTIGRSLQSITLGSLLVAVDEPVMTVLMGEAARANADLMGLDALDGQLRSRLEKGLSITEAKLDVSRRVLQQLAATEVPKLFSGADAILLPVMPLTTPAVVACEPSGPEFAPRTLYALSSFTRFVNALGLPAVSVPAGSDEHGLPVGLQLVGPTGSDRALIALACEIQRASEWHSTLPPVRAD